MIAKIIRHQCSRQLYQVSRNSPRAKTLIELEQKGIYNEVSRETIHLDRLSMTPHQYWIAKGRGMERPFTGEYWFNQEVGNYLCRVCKNNLFSFDDKYKTETGMASFWNHRQNSLELLDKLPNENQGEEKESQHVCCAQCKCHVGRVYFDGPPPTFIRYSINSSALNFELKPFFDDPVDIRERKKDNKQRIKQETTRNFVQEFEDDIQKK